MDFTNLNREQIIELQNELTKKIEECKIDIEDILETMKDKKIDYNMRTDLKNELVENRITIDNTYRMLNELKEYIKTNEIIIEKNEYFKRK